jgi:hypothetical protein
VEFLRQFPLLEFDKLGDAGKPLGLADLLTAAIVLGHGGRLLSRDAAFARVRGLRVALLTSKPTDQRPSSIR